MGVILKKPEVEATAILDGVWSELSPVRIPVDPVRIAKALGIDVFEAQLDADVSGAILKRIDRDPQIILNRDDHPNRQRFTAAHELGHYVLRQDDPDEYEFIDLRGPESTTGTREEEVFSNQFAAALLMPRDDVKSRAKEAQSAVELAFEFRVSQEAMTNRLSTLGITVG